MPKKEKQPYIRPLIIIGSLAIGFLLVYALAWLTGVVSICGDNRCDGRECSSCTKDCRPELCRNGVCDLVVGENCKNSQDCGCADGYLCKLERESTDNKGCYKVACGDSFCDSPSETQSNCCSDCSCPSGYRCDANVCKLMGPVITISASQEYQPSVTIMYANPDLYWGSPADRHALFTASLGNTGSTTAKNVQLGVKLGTYSTWVYKSIGDVQPNSSSGRVGFNVPVYDTILENTQPASITVSVSASYEDLEGKKSTKEHSFTINVKGKEWLDWSHPEFVAAWITDKDSVIREFAGKATRGLAPAVNSADISTAARRVWNQLGSYGVRYVSDPRGLEYASFPAETLKAKSGDCEDLAILYSTLLKSIGISTEIITTPGHALMAFYDDNGMHCVEATMLGQAFDSALDYGESECSGSYTRTSTEQSYISPPSSIDVGTISVPDVTYNGGSWSLTYSNCSSWGTSGCRRYLCKGRCAFTFQNSGESTGRKCGTFYVMINPSTYMTKDTGCIDVMGSSYASRELGAEWYDSSQACSYYSPSCVFGEE